MVLNVQQPGIATFGLPRTKWPGLALFHQESPYRIEIIGAVVEHFQEREQRIGRLFGYRKLTGCDEFGLFHAFS